MRPVRPDKKTKRLVTFSRAQPCDRRGDRDILMELVMSEMIEPVIFRVLIMRHLAERDDLVSELLQIRRQFFQVGAWAAVIRFRAIARGHQSRQERGPARRA